MSARDCFIHDLAVRLGMTRSTPRLDDEAPTTDHARVTENMGSPDFARAAEDDDDALAGLPSAQSQLGRTSR